MAYVAVGYRLTKEATHPAQVNDALSAVKFLAEDAEEWNIDASRIALIGGSAGGQLSMWVAYQEDAPRISAVVSIAGQTDLTQEFLETINPGLLRNPMLYRVFGTTADGMSDPEVQRSARHFSPITHMSKDSPPTFFIVGQEKPREESSPHKWGMHHPKFARHGRDRLRKLGVEAKLLEFDGSLDQFGDVMLAEEMKFLKEKLKPGID